MTENGAISLFTTENSLIDLFFKTVRDISKDELYIRLDFAWEVSPIDTIKIMLYTRDCRGGKGEKKIFAQFLTWLAGRDPTYLTRIWDYVPVIGSFRDLLLAVRESRGSDPTTETLIRTKAVATFASALFDDKIKLDGDPTSQISLVSKWAPSEASAFDDGIVASIAEKLNVSKKQYRKEYLAPLRKHLRIVERDMCARDWGSINFEHIPSVAVKNYKKAFDKHDHERWTAYLAKVKAGEAKMHTGVLHPHDIVSHYFRTQEHNDAVEAQWSSFVAEKRISSPLASALAIVDVSGSMSSAGPHSDPSLPLRVAVSLGLLIAELNTGKFGGKIITFTNEATVELVRGDTLYEKVMNVKSAKWGMTTNLQAAFASILGMAQLFSISQEDMPKTLFILSDMQFDQACPSNSRTNFEEIERKYAEAGYVRPRIVFWNLRAGTVDFPTQSTVPNVGLVSGFSAEILQLFLDTGTFNPIDVMRRAIDKERYDIF